MTPLRQHMSQDMTLRGLAPNTQKAYLSAVARLAQFYGRSPARISERKVQDYLMHLYRDRGLSHSTCNQAAATLRFFYHTTLRRRDTSFAIPMAR